MFSPNCVGTVNATCGGWGNLGGACRVGGVLLCVPCPLPQIPVCVGLPNLASLPLSSGVPFFYSHELCQGARHLPKN